MRGSHGPQKLSEKVFEGVDSAYSFWVKEKPPTIELPFTRQALTKTEKEAMKNDVFIASFSQALSIGQTFTANLAICFCR